MRRFDEDKKSLFYITGFATKIFGQRTEQIENRHGKQLTFGEEKSNVYAAMLKVIAKMS